MRYPINKLLALPLMVLVLAGTACSTTQETKLTKMENKTDAEGLPALTEEQQDQGIICKREPVTGTRLSKKTCTTQAQRDRAQAIAQEELRNTKARSGGLNAN